MTLKAYQFLEFRYEMLMLNIFLCTIPIKNYILQLVFHIEVNYIGTRLFISLCIHNTYINSEMDISICLFVYCSEKILCIGNCTHLDSVFSPSVPKAQHKTF